MNIISHSITVSFAVVLAATAAPAQTISPQDPPESGTKDWAQTHLVPAPSLHVHMERVQRLLDDHADGLYAQVAQLKADGLLDRRSSTKIRNALEDARGSFARLVTGIEAGQQIDGRSARMISYELGMAADVLTHQADAVSGDGSGPQEPQRRAQLIGMLREGSNLLREMAREIVRELE